MVGLNDLADEVDCFFKKYMAYEISPEEVKQRSENDMAGQYMKEAEGLVKVGGGDEC